MELIIDNKDNNKNDIVIGTFNEEKNIEKFVSYYKNFNIIIFDDNSNDNTIEIAKKLGCTVYLRNRLNEPKSIGPTEYAVSNYLDNYSKNGVVIKLDIDEFIDKDFLKILEVLNEKSNLNFVKERVEIIFGKKIKIFKSEQPLLIKKNKFTYDPLSLHRALKFPENIKYKNYIPVYHTGHPKGINKLIKILKYIDVEKDECRKKNNSYFLFSIKRYFIPFLLFPIRFFFLIFSSPLLFLHFLLNRIIEILSLFNLFIQDKCNEK